VAEAAAEPEAVREPPVQKAAEATDHPEDPAELISGNLAVAVPAGEPARGADLELVMDGAGDLVRAVAQDPGQTQGQAQGQAQVVELVRGWAPASERVVEAVRAQAQGVG
jgi:hypothetical protein